MRLISVIPVFLFPVLLFGYQPGRWNPLDIYIERDSPGGPRSLEVVDGNGAVIQKAEFSYDASGRLLKESYFGKTGIRDGETQYSYENGKVTAEILTNARGQILARKVFTYDGASLQTIAVYNAANELQVQTRYTMKGNKYISGVEGPAEGSDRYTFQYTGDRLDSISVLSSTGAQLSQIVYRYSENARLTEREKIQNSERSRCAYSYDDSGRITSYTYYNLRNENWIVEKKLNFRY